MVRCSKQDKLGHKRPMKRPTSLCDSHMQGPLAHIQLMPERRVTHPSCQPPRGSPVGVSKNRPFLWVRHLEAKPSKNFTGPQKVHKKVQEPREVPHLESKFSELIHLSSNIATGREVKKMLPPLSRCLSHPALCPD